MKRTRNPRKPRAPHNLILAEVVGLTTKNGKGLASSVSSTKCAYLAGCVVVLHDAVSGTQAHLVSPRRVPKPLSCVALSRDASIVAAGESGNQPAVLVWDCATLSFISELRGHQYGVACIDISHDGKYLVSVGLPHDGYICLWNWRNKISVAKVKVSSVSSPIASICFSLDDKFIVTAGKNHFGFWKVNWPSGSHTRTRSVSINKHRKVDLGHQEKWSFVAVTTPCWMRSSSANNVSPGERMHFFAVTEEGKRLTLHGTLCVVYPGSSVINSVELEVEKCFALSTSTSLVACACNNGIVKLFGSSSLKYAGRLCYVEVERCKGSNVVDCNTNTSQDEIKSSPTLPDAIACQFLTEEKLVVVYDDLSLYIWNIHDVDKATRCCVLVSHRGCIWNIINVPCENLHDSSLSCVAKGCSGGLSFTTCSADGTIRLWDLALPSSLSENKLSLAQDGSSCGATRFVSAGIFERDSVANDISSSGFRSMAISSDGKHLAAGDCRGNINIFNLHSSDFICIQDAHGADILSLSFNMANMNGVASTEALESHLFLASGGGDGGIRLFDVKRNFHLSGSISYHSCAVIAVKVAQNGHKILSCGADGSLVLHRVDVTDIDCKISCLQRIATSGTILDMSVDPQMSTAFTVSKGKKINAFDIQSGKCVKGFRHDGVVGVPMKVTTDGSCSYLACSYSSGCICIYEYTTGEMVAEAAGHSDVITGIIFLPDCKHLVSVDADGCIFVWELPALLSSKMVQRTKEVPLKFLPESGNEPMGSDQINSNKVINHHCENYSKEASVNGHWNQIPKEFFFKQGGSPKDQGFRFSVSRLPKWARHKVVTNIPPAYIDSSSLKVGLPQDSGISGSECMSKDVAEDNQQFSGTLSKRLSETESSQASASPPETYRWVEDNRWLTIHTVCMDLLDSPIQCDMQDRNAMGSAADIESQDEVIEATRSSKRIKLSSLDPNINNPNAEPKFGCTMHVDLRDSPSEEGKCLYKSDSPNHGANRSKISTSTNSHDTDKDADASRKDFHENSLKINCVNLSDNQNDTANALPGSPEQIRDIPRNDSEVPHIMPSGMPLKIELSDVKDQKVHNVDKVEHVEIVKSCEEALLNLEAAADNAMESFSKLANMSIGKGTSSRSGDQVHGKAAAMLQTIESKIHAIGKLLHQGSNFW